MDKVLIAFPCYNEAPYLGSLVLQAKEYGDVMVLDDGSSDNSPKIGKLAGAYVIANGKNLGYGTTIRHILKEAKWRQYDILVILDADNQHSTSDIPKMISAVQKGNDLVIGYREKKSIPLYRKVGQGIISFFVRWLSGSKVKDTQSGFRAFSKKAIETIELKQDGMTVSSEMIQVATKLGLKITEIPISVKYLKDSSTIHPVKQGIDTLSRVLSMISERKPLTFFGLGGLASLISGILIGIKAYNMLQTNEVLPIGTSLLAFLLLIIGILGVFTGIILNVIARNK